MTLWRISNHVTLDGNGGKGPVLAGIRLGGELSYLLTPDVSNR